MIFINKEFPRVIEKDFGIRNLFRK